MAFRNISVLLTANSTSLRSQLNQAATQVDRFANKVESHNKGLLSSGKLMAAGVGAGALAVAGAMAYAVHGAAQFEQQMRNVNSISYLGEAAFKNLSRSVIDLSKTVPQSANDLAAGLYDIASSGFQGSKGLTVLNASAIAASAGMSTTANAAKAITATLNAYGRGAEDSTAVSDALFQTVNLGVISFDELTGVIGDVVGTAAAASVDINQVGAAIATMTLSGLSGAESGTSLNRVLQSLLQPSDALTTLYHQMGYESGSAALKTKGLHGVMEDLRKATGGNIDALLALFPEIRSARGALALMSAEGKNYQKSVDGIENATNRNGATQKAFHEQMKATSAQFKIFMNRVNAGAITLGSKLLPVVVLAMQAMGRFGHDAIPVVAAALHALQPFFQHVADIGSDMVTVLKVMAEAATPAAKALAGLSALGIIQTLNAVSGAVAKLTDFLVHNKAGVALLAATISYFLIPALATVIAQLAGTAYIAGIMGLHALRTAATGATAGFMGLATAEAAATLGLSALAAITVLGVMNIVNANKKLKQSMKDRFAEAGEDPTNVDAINAAINAAIKGEKEVQRLYKSSKSLDHRFGFFTADADMVKAKRLQKEIEKNLDGLTDKLNQYHDNVQGIADETSIPWDTITGYAKTAGIDLTQTGVKGEEAKQKVVDGLIKMQEAAKTTTKVMQGAVGADMEAVQALAKALEDAQKAATDAFGGSTDVVKNFKLEDAATQADRVTTATDKLKDAQQSLNDLLARQKQDKKHTISDEQALTKARQKVAEATKGVTDAEGKVISSSGQLKKYYKDQLAGASKFVSDINKATAAGVDPQLIERLLEAGPEAAAPVLEGILSDHSGRMVKLVNDAEAKLREISTRVAEFARLTTLATSSTTDKMAKDLGKAMSIASINMAQGAKATVESIAKAIGVPSAEVKRIAEEYGITLVDAAQAGINKKPLTLPKPVPPAQRNDPDYPRPPGPKPPASTGPNTSSAHNITRAGGGPIYGPGTGTSDSIMARVSNGEYVIRAATVRKLGVGTLDRINAYAEGGLVRASSRPVVGLAPSSTASYTTVNRYAFNGPIVGVKMQDAIEYADRQKRLAALTGAE